jgi:hypothetical protein
LPSLIGFVLTLVRSGSEAIAASSLSVGVEAAGGGESTSISIVSQAFSCLLAKLSALSRRVRFACRSFAFIRRSYTRLAESFLTVP